MATVYDTASVIIPQGGGYKAGTLYGWNPQTENTIDFSVVRATTATRVNSAGLIESVAANVPRWDWAEGGCPSLLVEPQRTNLVTYSEQLDNAAWQKLNSSISADATTSPDGATTADKLVEDTATAEHIIRSSAISITSGNDYALTIFAKQSERSIIRMGADDQANLPGRAFFDLSTGTVGTVTGAGASASIESLSNGWYRCVLMATATGSVGGVNMEVNLATAGETVNYLGDGSSGVFLFGGQIEEGNYATSYIPTVASIVTRNADVISGTGLAALLGDSAGGIYAEWSYFDTSSAGLITISDGTANNTFQFGHLLNEDFYRLEVGNVVQAEASPNVIATNTFFKFGMRMAVNDFIAYRNGSSVFSDTSCLTFADGTLTKVSFDNGAGGNPFYGRIRELVIFNEAPTDSELIALTS